MQDKLTKGLETLIENIGGQTVYRMECYRSSPAGTGWDMESAVVIPTIYERFSQTKSRGYTSYPFIPLGKDNKYPYFLADLQKKSTPHLRAQTAIVNVAIGDGLGYRGKDVTPEKEKEMLLWLKTKGVNHGFLQKLFQSFAAFNGVYFRINLQPAKLSMTADPKNIPSTVGTISIPKYYHTRLGKPEPDGSILYHWEANFAKNGFYRSLKGYEVFDTDKFFEGGYTIGNHTVINPDKKPFVVKGYDAFGKDTYSYFLANPSLDDDYYPAACYENNSGINAILISEALLQFDISGLENGLAVSYIIVADLKDTSKADPDGYEKNKQEIKDKVYDELEGAENAQRSLLLFRDPRGGANQSPGIQIIPIPHTNNADVHKIIEDRSDKTILTVYGATDSRLLGIPKNTTGSLADQSDFLVKAEDMWYNTFMTPTYIMPVEEFLNDFFLRLYETEKRGTQVPQDGRIYFKRKRLFKREPSDRLAFRSLTIDEIREMFGYGPLSDEGRKEVEERIKVDRLGRVKPDAADTSFKSND